MNGFKNKIFNILNKIILAFSLVTYDNNFLIGLFILKTSIIFIFFDLNYC